MQFRWRGLELPTRVVCDRDTLTPSYGRFIAEPFERGYGITVGNSLRRILLSSIEGAAITSVKIEGVDHEFSMIPGVLDDVTDIILNLKKVRVRLSGPVNRRRVELVANVRGEVTAARIRCDANMEIVNPGQYIATLTEDITLKMEMTIRRGRGYVTMEENQETDGVEEIGVISVDSLFSPVTKVKIAVEDTRVGSRTNYNRLVIDIATDGTVKPEMALVEAAHILRKHTNPFVHYFEIGTDIIEEPIRIEVDADEEPFLKELQTKLSTPLSEMDLSMRASNCLEAENIRLVGDLTCRAEADLLKVRNFGRTSLNEIKKKLEGMGLSLGMSHPSNI